MTSGWANQEEIGTGGAFEAVHSGLTVQLIATQRDQLAICATDEPASAVIERNVEGFDFFPVVGKDAGGDRIVGLFHAAAFSDGAVADGEVCDHLIPLAEDYLIGADASILDFVIDADAKPCRVVLTGPRISGLVSLSDLQKLPVRAALFALITGFEIVMMEAIRKVHASADDWMRQLSPGRQKALRQEIEKSRTDDGYVDALLFTQFCDKTDIVCKSFSLGQSKTKVGTQLDEIQKLRDSLAHANEYAATPHDARHVCAVVRNIVALKDEIANAVREIGASPETDRDRRAMA